MLREHLTITSGDGLKLEGELVTPDDPWAGALLTHPNSSQGGNMRSMVPGELIEALPAMGVATLRFNFRGVGNSEGQFENGDGERLDVVAALSSLHEIVEGLPIAVCGSSFGANTSLTVDDPRISGWCALAATLPDERLAQMQSVAMSDRPKRLVVAERDNYRLPDGIRELAADWRNTEIIEIPGADHFFVGRLELAIAAACEFVESLRRS